MPVLMRLLGCKHALRRAAGENMQQFVAGFARIQNVLNSGESSFGSVQPAARVNDSSCAISFTGPSLFDCKSACSSSCLVLIMGFEWTIRRLATFYRMPIDSIESWS